MATLVDSSVVLDIILTDPVWGDWSRDALGARRTEGPLYINQIVFAEALASVDPAPEMALLLDRLFERRSLPWEAMPLAGQAHAAYRRRGGARQTILPDFLIGAHAAIEGLVLLTRDPRRVKTAFADLKVVSPD